MSSESSWQSWIVGFAEANCNVLQSEIAYPPAQALRILWYDILRDDAAARADNRGQSYRVVAATRADVRDGHSGFNAEPTYELAWFAGIVALFFVVPDWADNIRNRAIGFRKGGDLKPSLKSWPRLSATRSAWTTWPSAASRCAMEACARR